MVSCGSLYLLLLVDRTSLSDDDYTRFQYRRVYLGIISLTFVFFPFFASCIQFFPRSHGLSNRWFLAIQAMQGVGSLSWCGSQVGPVIG